MAENYEKNHKVYQTDQGEMLSIMDMLSYFKSKGTTRVSDLHIKVGAPPCYRIDGDLVKLEGPDVDDEIARGLLFPLLSQEGIEKFEAENSIDCSYRIENIQLRINIFRENDGIAGAIRALNLDIMSVDDVGFPNNVWADIIARKQGLVLLTGITGAGKSTTIAAMIDRINQERPCRIITVEDPIEYIFSQNQSLISQREIGRDVGDFATGLRAMLREDPDVILVGEMRDAETVAMALMAAETGHLVFSTLHTRNAIGTITRILDYFPSDRQDEVRNQLSLSLAYIISQKLIPKKNGKGRVVAMEILNNNYACANLIRTGKIEQIYSQLQTKTKNKPDEKMMALENHLALLVKDGSIDAVEARKWANDLNCFIHAMNVTNLEEPSPT